MKGLLENALPKLYNLKHLRNLILKVTLSYIAKLILKKFVWLYLPNHLQLSIINE